MNLEKKIDVYRNKFFNKNFISALRMLLFDLRITIPFLQFLSVYNVSRLLFPRHNLSLFQPFLLLYIHIYQV